MPEDLSLHDNCLRDTLGAHTFREGLVIWAIVVHFVTRLRKWYAILTFGFYLMLTLALSFDSREVMLEALMFNNPLVVFIGDAIRASLVRWMLAGYFR